VSLFKSTWGVSIKQLQGWGYKAGVISKLVAIILPAILIALANIDSIRNNFIAYFILNIIVSMLLHCIPYTVPGLIAYLHLVIITPIVGGILIILILYKYIQTRKQVASSIKAVFWRSSRDTRTESGSNPTVVSSTSEQSIYDHALIVRFSMGFTFLASVHLPLLVLLPLQS
jgi:hypothetical protein